MKLSIKEEINGFNANCSTLDNYMQNWADKYGKEILEWTYPKSIVQSLNEIRSQGKEAWEKSQKAGSTSPGGLFDGYKELVACKKQLSDKSDLLRKYLDTRSHLETKVADVEKALQGASTDIIHQEEINKVGDSISIARKLLKNKEASTEKLSEGLQRLNQDYKQVIKAVKLNLEQVLANTEDILKISEEKKLFQVIKNPGLNELRELFTIYYDQRQKDIQKDEIKINDLVRTFEAINKTLKMNKLLIAVEIQERYRDVKNLYDTTKAYWEKHEGKIAEKITQEQMNIFMDTLGVAAKNVENDQRLKALTQKSEDLEPVLSELKLLIEKGFPEDHKRLMARQFPNHSIEYNNSESIYTAPIACFNEYQGVLQTLTTIQANDLNDLMEETHNLNDAVKKMENLYILEKKLKDIRYLEEIKPTSIEQFLIQNIGRGTPSNVFWAVDNEQNILLVEKDVEAPSGQKLEIADTIMSQEQSIQAQGEAIVVIAKIFPFAQTDVEACLIDINSKGASNMVDDSHLQIGKEAFRKKIPLLEDVLQLLNNQEASTEQTSSALSALFASERAEGLWKKLSGEQHDSQLEDNDSSDQTISYTKGEEARARMAVELAAELSSTTKDIKNQFHIGIVPHRSDVVKYEDSWNRLYVSIDAPPLKTVLTIISEMDRAKYEWATPQDAGDAEKYAQAAATAIRQIEACQKLKQPVPQDLSQDLLSLASAYITAYNAAPEDTKENAARLCIYNEYAKKCGVEKLDPSLVDTREYQVYDPQFTGKDGHAPNIEEIRWKIFPNLTPGDLYGEIEIAKHQGVKPAILKVEDPHIDEIISGGKLVWVISMGEKILVGPRVVNSSTIIHTMLTEGRPGLAGGEIEISKCDDGYIILSMNHRSGHLRPQQKFAYAIGLYDLHGFRFRRLPSVS